MSERTPQPETVRERAVAVIAHWWGIDGAEYADNIVFALESAGLTIIDTAALEPGEDDGDGGG